MKRTTIAYVNSSKDQTKRYLVIKRGNRFECTCLDFFFAENRDIPCRHIKQIMKTTFSPEVKKLASVTFTAKGLDIVRDRVSRPQADPAP